MARGAVKAKKQAKKAQVRRPPQRGRARRSARTGQQEMFFPMLRRQAKWVFVFLAVVFAAGFVVFGVGTGGGVGLGDLFKNSGGGSSHHASVSDAQKKIAANPKDAPAYRELATAYETEGKLDGAIGALRRFTKLRPHDRGGLVELGGLYTRKAGRLQPLIQAASAEYQQFVPGSTFTPPALQSPGNPKTKQPPAPLTSNPIIDTASSQLQTRFSKLLATQQHAYTSAEKVYVKIVRAKNVDPQLVLQLGEVSQQAGDAKTALNAYRAFIKLAPDDPTVPLVKQQLKPLEQAAKRQASPALWG